MLHLPFIRENRELIIERYKKRQLYATKNIDAILSLDERRKDTQLKLDNQLSESNKLAKEIGDLFKQGKKDEAEKLKGKTVELKDSSSQLKEQLQKIEEEQKQLLYLLPNVPREIVPAGKNEEDNKIVFEAGAKTTFDFKPLPHWELAKKYNLIDFELGVKITGAGFPIYRGKGAALQRALINFFLDEAREAGYEEIIPPHLVNEASGIGTGQLPDKE